MILGYPTSGTVLGSKVKGQGHGQYHCTSFRTTIAFHSHSLGGDTDTNVFTLLAVAGQRLAVHVILDCQLAGSFCISYWPLGLHIFCRDVRLSFVVDACRRRLPVHSLDLYSTWRGDGDIEMAALMMLRYIEISIRHRYIVSYRSRKYRNFRYTGIDFLIYHLAEFSRVVSRSREIFIATFVETFTDSESFNENFTTSWYHTWNSARESLNFFDCEKNISWNFTLLPTCQNFYSSNLT